MKKSTNFGSYRYNQLEPLAVIVGQSFRKNLRILFPIPQAEFILQRTDELTFQTKSEKSCRILFQSHFMKRFQNFIGFKGLGFHLFKLQNVKFWSFQGNKDNCISNLSIKLFWYIAPRAQSLQLKFSWNKIRNLFKVKL